MVEVDDEQEQDRNVVESEIAAREAEELATRVSQDSTINLPESVEEARAML